MTPPYTTEYKPLTRGEMVRVIEGRGCARRIPVLLHKWTYPSAFADPAEGRLLFTLGNGITGDTPIPSLEALFDEAFAYGTDIVSREARRVCRP